MNIYEKMNNLKEQFAQTELKKSGKNKFAQFEYFELKDIIPTILKLEKEIGLYSLASFDNDCASLTFYDIDKPTDIVVTKIPMITDFDMAKANKAQSMGAVTTYFRRYLYVNALNVLENDEFDATSGKEETKIPYKKQEFKASPTKVAENKPKKSGMNNPANFVLTFGKEKGKTLGTVQKENPGYIKWLSENGKDDVKKAALALLPKETVEDCPF